MFSFSLSCLWIYVMTPAYAAAVTPPGSLSLRLLGESSSCRGMVHMQSKDQWLPVCGDFWSSTLALIACRTLGCGRLTGPSDSPVASTGNQTSLFLNISCAREDLLEDCNVSQISHEVCNTPVILNCTDPPRLRLSGGESRCEGGVEIFRDGVWGSVCDDGWDALDAHVACQQLGCGSALQALGASHFGSGPSKIHLNELSCSGAEHYLWECPARNKHDCTAEEHAGVICAEHKAVRVFGGSDRCSGRVEVYMGGVWGTVCDSHWFDDDAKMLCKTLGCGSFMRQTSHDHSLSTYMGFVCKNATSLWDCAVYHKNPNFCRDSRALGVVCRGLSTLETSTQRDSTTVTATGLLAVGPDSGVVDVGKAPLYMIGLCAALAVLLLTSIITFLLIIWRMRKQQRISLQSVSRTSANEYRESIFSQDKSPGPPLQMSAHRDLTRSRQPVPVAIPDVPPEVVEGPHDSDDYEFGSRPPEPLITFHDSFQRQHELRVTQEDHTQEPWGEALQTQQKSVWSSRSSSTSSEEQNWYENYRQQGNHDLTPPPQSHAGSSEYDDIISTGSG